MRVRVITPVLILAAVMIAWSLVRPAPHGPERSGLVPASRPETPAGGIDPGIEPARGHAARAPAAPSRPGAPGADSATGALRARTRPSPPAEPVVIAVGARVLGPDGAPVHGATLELPAALGASAVSSDAQGHARSRVAVANAGAGLATVFAPGLARVRVATTWEPGRDTWLGDVRLARAGAVSGVVVDEHSTPVAGIDVFLLEPDRDQWGDPRRHSERGEGRAARTDAAGLFFLQDLAEGTHQAFARAPDRPWTRSTPFLVSPGSETDSVRVELASAAPESYVRGVLLDATGVPTDAASILYDPVDTRTHGNRRVRPRSDGRFELALAQAVPHRIEVEPDDWEASVVRVPAVQPGARDLVLRIEPPRWLWVRVRDAAGAPLSAGRVEALFADRDERQPRAISDLWPDGRARLHRPLEDFRLRANVPGYEPRISESYSLGVAEPIELTLREIPAVRGVVTRAGAPVAGAEVELWLPSAGDLRGRRVVTGRCDARGAFTLPIHPRLPREPARMVVMACAPDGLHAFGEPFVLDPERGVSGLEVAIEGAGAIAGRLLLPAGMRAGGWSVFAYDRFGVRREVPAADDGAFRLEPLASGRWTLGASDPTGRAAPLLDTDPAATVRAGSDAPCDVRVAEPERASLVGRLVIEGHPLLDAWSVTCRMAGQGAERETVLDADGTFRFALDAPARVELTFRSLDPVWRHLVVTHRMRLQAGENECVVRFAAGEVYGTYSVPGAENARVERLVLSSAAADVSYRATLEPRGAPLAPTLVPAGEAYLSVERSPEVAAALATGSERFELSLPRPKVRVPAGGRLDLGAVRGDD